MAAKISLCSFNKFGFCKFGGKCRKIHYSEICEQHFCENIKYCEKRHPRRCYFYCAYGFCTFGNVANLGMNTNIPNLHPKNLLDLKRKIVL